MTPPRPDRTEALTKPAKHLADSHAPDAPNAPADVHRPHYIALDPHPPIVPIVGYVAHMSLHKRASNKRRQSR